MKKILFSILLCVAAGAAYADNEATVGIHINDPVKTNKYFMCIYDEGCISIKAADKGKTFPMPAMDVGNIKEFVITDATTMQEFMVPTNTTCNINVHEGQKLTLTGELVVQNNKPTIKHLQCHVA